MPNKKIKTSVGDKIFTIFNYSVMIFLIIIMIYPMWHELMYSLSDSTKSAVGGIFIIPRGFTLSMYKTVLGTYDMWKSFLVSIIVTVVGTGIGTFLSATTAYPLSRPKLRGKRFFTILILFTMLFSGGMVPGYLLIRSLGLIDSIWSLILPNLLNAYFILIMISFFKNIPESLEESAKIDGASDITVFFKIILPLSKASIAAIALFTAIAYWGDYMSSILYIISKGGWSLQAYLRNVLTNTAQAMSSQGVNVAFQTQQSAQGIQAVTVIIATIPILIVYPFLQKHFAAGVMIGSVKG